MTQEQITLLRAIPIEDLASRLGLDVRHHKALCPCFVCDAHGDTIDLVRHLLNKDFQQACLYLSDGSIEPIPAHSTHSTHETQSPFDPSRYAPFFDRPYLSPEARRFLFDQRRLDPRVIRWCRLTSWRDRQGTDWLQIPYYDREGKLVGLQNRNLTPGGEPRFKFPKGAQCGIYNLPVLNKLEEGEALYIAEGASDCWALLSAGHKAIAIPSATLLKKDDLQPLLTLNSELLTQFHMYPDRDLPGERLFLQLQSLLPNLTHHHLPPPCKDYSDLYLQLHPPTTMNLES